MDHPGNGGIHSKPRDRSSDSPSVVSGNNEIRRLDEILGKEPSVSIRQALCEVIYQHAQQDPKLACEAYRRLAASGEFDVEVSRFLGASLSGLDAEDALFWIRSLPRGAHRKAAMAELCVQLAPAEPAHAADLATLNLPLDDANKAVFVRIAAEWAAHDPEQAANWAGRFPAGMARAEAMKAVLSSWDAASARQWVSTVNDHSLRADVAALLADSP